MRYRQSLMLLLVIGVLGACGSQTQPTSMQQQAQSTASIEPPIAQAIVASPTATLAPSPSPVPSTVPSSTPFPTLEATATVEPTSTAPPTALPKPSPAPSATTAATAPVDVPALEAGSAAPTAAPAADQIPSGDPQLPVRLTIPSLGLDHAPIPVGLDENRIPIVPKHDVGWYTYSARPGQGDNIVLWGHVLRWKDSPNIPAPFAGMKDIQIGAQVVVYTADGTARHYRVSEIVWATPDQVEYILPTGSERLTLVSCIGDKVISNGSVELTHRQITIAMPDQ